MTKKEIIRNLKYTMEKHKNDRVDTFGTNIPLMCKDILDYLEKELYGKDINVPAEDGKKDVLDKVKTEIEKQDKWLAQAGYNAYNVDIAFNSIKRVIAESEE